MSFRLNTRGVTSVIGTILIVGITIILVAVVGAATLTLVDEVQNPPPTVTVETDQQRVVVVETNGFNGTAPSAQANLSVTLTHISGAAVDPDRLSVTVNGYPAYDVYDANDPGYATLARPPVQSTFSAGSRLRIVVYGFVNNTKDPGTLFNNPSTLKKDVTDQRQPERANELRPGDTVRLIWTSPSGLNRHTLTEYTIQ